MKKLTYLILILFAVGCFTTSCEKESESGFDTKIIGTWGLYKEFDSEEGWWNYEEGEDLIVVEFTKNGTGTYYEYCPHYDETLTEPLKWNISGNQITVHLLDDEEITTSEIVTLTDEELVLEFSDDEDYTEISYYVKVD